jgi:DNA invertase Pin-like site-specific DNA recombinase
MSTAIDVRVSTERQTLAQTIEQQVERLIAHVHAQGETLRPENIFRDDGYSGATLNRPGLDRLRDRVKEGALDRVVIASPDRLARNYVHQMLLLEEFARVGCLVECLDQPLGQDPQAHLLLQIRGAVAAYERTFIAERLRRGRQRKLQAGVLLPWTVPPDGYRLHPDRPRDPAGVQIEPTEGAMVQEVLARYLEAGGTLLGLAKHLLRLGIKSPPRRWSARRSLSASKPNGPSTSSEPLGTTRPLLISYGRWSVVACASPPALRGRRHMGIAMMSVAVRPNPYTRSMINAVRRGTARPSSSMPSSGKTCVTSSPTPSGWPTPWSARMGAIGSRRHSKPAKKPYAKARGGSLSSSSA